MERLNILLTRNGTEIMNMNQFDQKYADGPTGRSRLRKQLFFNMGDSSSNTSPENKKGGPKSYIRYDYTILDI